MLPLAAWAATNPPAVLLFATVLIHINLQGSYAPRDFGVFLDASIGSLVGIFIAFVCIALVRRLGRAHALERLAADVQRDIGALTYQRTAAAIQRRLTRGSTGSGLEALDVERTAASAEITLAASDAKLASDRVTIFLALGGGWETGAAN